MTLSEYINEPMNQIFLRNELERASVANQLAVIGYMKMHSVQRYLARTLNDAEYRDACDTIRASRLDLLQDLNMKAIDAALDYKLYSLDW